MTGKWEIKFVNAIVMWPYKGGLLYRNNITKI